MPLRSCQGKFWVFKPDQFSVEKGRDSYEAFDYEHLTFYDSESERDADPDLIAFESVIADGLIRGKIAAFDKAQEHAGKSENADRWWHNSGALSPLDPLYDVGDYSDVAYPWIAAEIEVFDTMTPRQCVMSIRAAAAQALSKAKERAAMRKSLQQDSTPPI